MTEKELRKLKRSDFLQLLITQGREMSAVQARLDVATNELERLRAEFVMQNAKLNEKDEMIANLMGRLDDKEATINDLLQEIEDVKANRRIELEQAGSIAMAALSLNGVFETAQKAADQYLYNIHLMHNELDSKCKEKHENQQNPEKFPPTFNNEPLNKASAQKPKVDGAAKPEQKTGLFGRLRMRGTR